MKTINARVFSGGTREFPVSRIEYFRPSVYGLAVQNDTILLLQNKNSDRLSLPGGGIELGKTTEEALKREFAEETGLDIQIDQFLAHVQDFFYYDPKDILVHTFLFFYACTPITQKLLADHEVNDDESEKPRWIPIDSLKPENLVSNGCEVLNFAQTGMWQ